MNTLTLPQKFADMTSEDMEYSGEGWLKSLWRNAPGNVLGKVAFAAMCLGLATAAASTLGAAVAVYGLEELAVFVGPAVAIGATDALFCIGAGGVALTFVGGITSLIVGAVTS